MRTPSYSQDKEQDDAIIPRPILQKEKLVVEVEFMKFNAIFVTQFLISL